MNVSTIKDSRSLRTRETLVRTAELLFADQGFEAVSVNTITRQANQNNRNAVQYHFGNKTGLLQAIFDKHSPGVAAKRAELIDELQNTAQPIARSLATAIVAPLLDKLEDPDGGEAYIHISAELIASNTLGYSRQDAHPLQIPRETKLAKLAANQLTHLPPEIGQQRILMMNVLAFHGISDHARVRKNRQLDPMMRDTDFMASNLIDSITAMLEAQPSPDTLQILKQRQAI
ncbi:TetR/AcrR family transcriptional regulator [Zhongshania sp.]|uniref:TetR/AcrR family transcriptional regulator n=1 Tax=Zhongshania sp. TaxID=1971902 RepID=UPI003561C847